MTKENLKQLLINGKLGTLADQLEKASSKVDKDLQNEILLQISRYRVFTQQQRVGALSREDQDVSLSLMSASFLEVIDALPENLEHKQGKRFVWPLILGTSVVVFVVVLFWMFSDYDLKKSDTAPEKEKDLPALDNVKTKDGKEEINSMTMDSSQLSKQRLEDKTIQKPSNTTFNNTTVNGPQIIEPSGPITINNDYSEKKDTSGSN